jgi:hypothetical protein
MKTKLFLLLAALTFWSCSTEDLPPLNADAVIISLDTPNEYTWSNLDDPNMGWETLANHTGKYSFTLSGNKATLSSKENIISAIYYTNTMDRKGAPLEIHNNTITATLTENGSFKIKY